MTELIYFKEPQIFRCGRLHIPNASLVNGRIGERMFFDQFDAIYIVNLPERGDRKTEMLRELKRVGLRDDPRVHFFEAKAFSTPGPFARVGSHGAFLSHLEILKKANRGETILILQDDCNFCSFARKFSVLQDWDIFYGGYSASDENNLQDSDIIGAHCMAFKPNIIPRLVSFLEAVYEGRYRPPEYMAREENRNCLAAPIDGAIVWFRRANPDVETVFHKISYQRSSKTDIGTPSRIDSFAILARVARIGLRALQRIKTSK